MLIIEGRNQNIGTVALSLFSVKMVECYENLIAARFFLETCDITTQMPITKNTHSNNS